jgi:hypothetical protein
LRIELKNVGEEHHAKDDRCDGVGVHDGYGEAVKHRGRRPVKIICLSFSSPRGEKRVLRVVGTGRSAGKYPGDGNGGPVVTVGSACSPPAAGPPGGRSACLDMGGWNGIRRDRVFFRMVYGTEQYHWELGFDQSD